MRHGCFTTQGGTRLCRPLDRQFTGAAYRGDPQDVSWQIAPASATFVVDSQDLQSIREEIRSHGWEHLTRFLEESGLAFVSETRTISNCNHLSNCIDLQFDSPGCPVERVVERWSCPALGLAW